MGSVDAARTGRPGLAVGRAEAAVAAQVASRATVTGGRETLAGGTMGLVPGPCRLESQPLLRQRRVTLHAAGGLRRVEGQKLPHQPRREGLRVQRGSPFFVPVGVAGAANLGRQGSLALAPVLRRGALLGERQAPVVVGKDVTLLAAREPRRGGARQADTHEDQNPIRRTPNPRAGAGGPGPADAPPTKPGEPARQQDHRPWYERRDSLLPDG